VSVIGMDIYLDTNLWNELVDQAIPAQDLHAALRQQDKRLALGDQTLFELSQTFSVAPERAQVLFAYVRAFAELGVTVTHSMQEMLHREAKSHGAPVGPFAVGEQYQRFLSAVQALSAGTLDGTVVEEIALRQQSVPSNRSGQQKHLINRQDKRDALSKIAEHQLPTWLDEEMRRPQGLLLLVGHLARFLGIPESLGTLCAQELMACPTIRIAKALVRADLYFNWRCAQVGSIKKDLQHDVHHVLSASYCDLYATKETNHARYAHLLLSQETGVGIFDKSTAIDAWLLGLT
jgi:hypothetical protein